MLTVGTAASGTQPVTDPDINTPLCSQPDASSLPISPGDLFSVLILHFLSSTVLLQILNWTLEPSQSYFCLQLSM